MADDARVMVHQAALRDLVTGPTVRALLLDAANQRVVPRARATAPRRTGRGAASIHTDAVLDDGEWTAHIGWSRERFYLYFHEAGTRYLAPRPFLVPALEAI